jgi:hypothetical protein
MGKGLSPLQTEILAVLEQWPSLEKQRAVGGSYDLSTWARPRDIIRALGRPSTPTTRTSVSRALARLCDRGVVTAASGQLAIAGKGFRYVRIANQRK